MIKILIVDDEAAIRALISKYASMQGYVVVQARDGAEALEILENDAFDIIVLDVMMPRMDGYELSKEIRRFSDVPIIMLTARDSDYDKFQGFEFGVDDYVVKPFSPRELMYRVEAILKRGRHFVADIYTYQTLEVNFTGRSFKIAGQRVDLSPKEFDLLAYFIRNKDIALERDGLINAIWGYDFDGDSRTLDTHIKRLRKKMGSFQRLIVTLRGMGYRYEER